MLAVRLHEVGGPERLVVEQIDEPMPREGETIVRLRAAALNHRDLFITQGRYASIALPCTLGADGAGVCGGREVVIDPTLGWGNDERVWSEDATILGMPRDGTFAQSVAVPVENVHPKPEHLSFEEAAALPLAGVTAYRALFTRGRLQGGERILITGVGGGVQTFVLLFAKAAGARIAVTSGTSGKLDRARSLGAEVAIDYHEPNWHKEVRARMGSLDLAIDSAGGDSFGKALGLLRRGGRAVTYGGTLGDANVRLYSIFWNQLDIFGASMGSPTDFAAMLAFVRQHHIRPVIDREYEMADVGAAMQRMSNVEQFGKIVLKI